MLSGLHKEEKWQDVVNLEREVLPLATRLRGEHPVVAAVIHRFFGDAFQGLGKYAQAREMHEQSKAMAEETGNREGVAKACGNLGDCYRSTGDYGRAREMFEQEKTISEELGDRVGVATACGNLGTCYRSAGDYVRAREMHEQHKAMAEALGDRAGVARGTMWGGPCAGARDA